MVHIKNIRKLFSKYDSIVRDISAFPTFDALVTARGDYRPSLCVGSTSRAKYMVKRVALNIKLATAYNLYMELIEDSRRAFEYTTGG